MFGITQTAKLKLNTQVQLDGAASMARAAAGAHTIRHELTLKK
jgi:hypothetical protein